MSAAAAHHMVGMLPWQGHGWCDKQQHSDLLLISNWMLAGQC
jgi:hypothetical protein